MKDALRTIAAALALTLCAQLPGAVDAARAAASPAAGLAAADREHGTVGAPDQIAWSQKIIRIGPNKTFHSWECHVAGNGVLYVSGGLTEGSARALLAPYAVYGHIRCDREPPGLL
jgi:hypothetical protein